MASQKEKAALRGSIVDPATADKVIELLALSGSVESILASSELQPAATVAAIPTPGSASASDCATKINAILAALTAAGLMDAD